MKGKKQGNIQAQVAKISEICVAIRPKSQAKSSPITVGFTENSLNSCYTPAFPTILRAGKSFRSPPGPGWF